jgi:cytochrome c peroxidase
LFYGRLRCSTCHSGPLLTDQLFHNIGIPDLSPGAAPDSGRARVTGRPADRFHFRTPSLRNVMLTEPWMHDGVFTRMDAVIRHYRDPVASLARFDAIGLDGRFAPLLDRDPATLQAILSTLDPAVSRRLDITDEDVRLITAFLHSLTDPVAANQLREIPARVPSGLPVFD